MRWFELIPGHELVRAFYRDPIDVSRPRYELARGYGFFLAGALLIALAVALDLRESALVGVASWLIIAGFFPLVKLVVFGIGKLAWPASVIAFVIWLFEGSPLEYFGVREPAWLAYFQLAMGALIVAALVMGTAKLAKEAWKPTPAVGEAAISSSDP